ncbi:MAG: cellobiose phosphorylase [Candidatus Omnitrophica bacterium]|jgi:hypothetical protein|nr:cellobiose phosphorylase [Candidatus Omnitrophota bacterium]
MSAKTKIPKYYLNSEGEFVIENYNYAKPFANFFPGIAGKYGIPMWVFYVNRGQAIASFGIKDKDHAILEFSPANKSWQFASLQGFRTFIKVSSGSKKNIFYEPFHNGFVNLGFKLSNQMKISSYDLKLEETNATLGLKINVEYFTVPDDSYAALVRIISVKNTAKTAKKIQFLDGLPQIVPFGMNHWLLKELSRTLEAWMTVNNLKQNVPFYKLAVDPADKPEVIHLDEGNFYLAFHYEKKVPKIIKPIVSPQSIFGPVTDFSCPYEFISENNFIAAKNELTDNKTPCGFMAANFQLKPGEEKIFYSLSGYMHNEATLNRLVPKIIKSGYLAKKRTANKLIINGLQDDIDTQTGSQEFNLYTRQTYLDNIIRGGYPIVFESGGKKSVLYIYSRKHGDLERDYNRFQIQPSYFSQGNGNYRDVNQNRRMDVWFNPEIEDENIITFFNLLQTDGFNPLVIKGVSFALDNTVKLNSFLKGLMDSTTIEKLSTYLKRPFTPGNLILFIQKNNLELNIPYDDFLNLLIPLCLKIQQAEHGEGFWTDHWAYNLDLLENYLSIYPEKLKELFFNKKVFTYFDNGEVVRPRNEKYTLYNGLPRQLNSVTLDAHKKDLIKKRIHFPNKMRSGCGEGEIYQTNLVNKLFCLAVNKLASLDPFGVGIEMEANKPNWYDALNGLPALFGSSTCETFELKRLLITIKTALEKTAIDKISLTKEICGFLTTLKGIIQEHTDSNSPDKDYIYWDKATALKEAFRKDTLLGFSGKEIEVSAGELIEFLNKAQAKIDFGLAKAFNKKEGMYYAYFINTVTEYDPLDNRYIRPTKFSQVKIPFFLESQMHALRLSNNAIEAKNLYQAVKSSPLYDKKLKMYKVTASLKDMPEEIGRCKVFTPGWLENESIWLHMEYKYILEILKHGLSEEFYSDFKNVLIPLLKPTVYGRSVLENSSFITSSAFPDKNLHGNGFVARLSGSTAEFLQIWLIMNLGRQPFFLNNHNQLNLKFNPQLVGWLFTKKDKTYSFNFLSKVQVIYHNPKICNTFGKNKVSPKKILFADKNGLSVEIHSDTIPSPYAEQIRSRLIKRIDIYLD